MRLVTPRGIKPRPGPVHSRSRFSVTTITVGRSQNWTSTERPPDTQVNPGKGINIAEVVMAISCRCKFECSAAADFCL